MARPGRVGRGGQGSVVAADFVSLAVGAIGSALQCISSGLGAIGGSFACPVARTVSRGRSIVGGTSRGFRGVIGSGTGAGSGGVRTFGDRRAGVVERFGSGGTRALRGSGGFGTFLGLVRRIIAASAQGEDTGGDQHKGAIVHGRTCCCGDGASVGS